MISNTGGYSTRKILRRRRDELSSLATPCQNMKSKGKCKEFNIEVAIRRELALEKEKEVRRKAEEMYGVHRDLLEDAKLDGEEALAEATAALGPVAQLNMRDKEQIIQYFIQEIKQEPAYKHWNLEAAVAEEMVKRGVRHCPFSHTVEVQQTLKRVRDEQKEEEKYLERLANVSDTAALAESRGQDGDSPLQPNGKAIERKLKCSLPKWTEERQKTFDNFTIWQKYIVVLLWQESCLLPLRVIQDVRKLLTRLAEKSFETKTSTVKHKSLKVTFPDFNGSEEALDEYLNSVEFENLVKKEEQANVPVVFSDPKLGIVNLSALPQVILYISKENKKKMSNIIRDETVSYFVKQSLKEDQTSAPKPHPLTCALTEKELDASQANRAEELVAALEWYLYAYGKEQKLSSQGKNELSLLSAVSALSSSNASEANNVDMNKRDEERRRNTNILFSSSRPLLRSFVMQNAKLSTAESLITALYKHNLHRHLLALDLSHNQLSSLRFIFMLKANYSERLLRLSLKNNIITRKPEYQEQVRLCLPKLTSLDGEPIRRPPLRFPKPLPVSSSLYNVTPPDAQVKPAVGQLTAKEQADILETISRIFYIFETGYLPLTPLQVKRFRQENGLLKAAEEELRLPDEELADEDNFPHRYLDPMCTFSLCLSSNVVLFDPSRMRLNREVEMDNSYTGMRLSAEDLKDVRVFDVSMKNSSRNLLLGRALLNRTTRGVQDCYLGYRCTLYPERFEVCHNLGGCNISIVKFDGERKKGKDGKDKEDGTIPAAKKSLFAIARLDSTKYVVTLHGLMTWRLPSMKQDECLSAAYERTITLVKKQIPLQNAAWEKLHSPPMVIVSDVVLLRPADSRFCLKGPVGGEQHPLVARATRLVVQFGLEVCRDGLSCVQAVMERCTSLAAEEAVLDTLVFGPPPIPDPATSEEQEVQPHVLQANEEVRVLLKAKRATGRETSTTQKLFTLFSVLDGRPSSDEAQIRDSENDEKWGTNLHDIHLEEFNGIIEIMNRNYTFNFFSK